MKKRIPTFVAGMLTMALIGSTGLTALAATGQLTITVDPVNIQVNGATFAPTDAKGNSVPVFALNGTTYAPLRALAEAYGLEVGYDKGSNMATVGEKSVDPATTQTPDTVLSDDYSTWTAEEEAAYQEFKGMWEVKNYADGTELERGFNDFRATYIGELEKSEFISIWNENAKTRFESFCARLAREVSPIEYSDSRFGISFYYGDLFLVSAFKNSDGTPHCFIDPIS